VGPLSGQNRSAFIRVVVRVDACHSSIVESAGLEAGASSHADPYLADPYLASGVVDAAGQFLEQRQMDFILSTNVNGPRRGWMELVCLASAPGLVDTHQTARDLRRAIEDSFVGGPWKGAAIIRHLEATTSTEAEFQTARAALAGQVREDSAFHLVLLQTRSGVRRRDEGGAEQQTEQSAGRRSPRWGAVGGEEEAH
jgi:hypothetical protein